MICESGHFEYDENLEEYIDFKRCGEQRIRNESGAFTKMGLSIKKTNEKIGELGIHTSQIYDELNTLQKLFDDIRNVPSEKRLEYKKLKKFV